MEALSVGPFVIPGFVVEVAIALAAGLVALVAFARRNAELRRTVIDLLSTSLIVYIVLWKLGPLFSTPAAVVQQPQILLFARGGTAGIVAGALGAAGYLAFAVVRRKLLRAEVLALLAVFLVVSAGAYGATQLAAGVGGSARSAEGGRTEGPPQAPDFTLERLEDGAFSLAAAEGKPVVLNFWATWCGPCRAETPVKKRLAGDYGESIHFIGVNLTTSEGSVREVREYVDNLEVNYPIVLDTQGRVQQLYGIRGTPTTYIIDAKGRVVHKFMGAMAYGDMKRRLESLLGR
jgi:thiol-disulfide isomerase/thioredoxin